MLQRHTSLDSHEKKEGDKIFYCSVSDEWSIVQYMSWQRQDLFNLCSPLTLHPVSCFLFQSSLNYHSVLGHDFLQGILSVMKQWMNVSHSLPSLSPFSCIPIACNRHDQRDRDEHHHHPLGEKRVERVTKIKNFILDPSLMTRFRHKKEKKREKKKKKRLERDRKQSIRSRSIGNQRTLFPLSSFSPDRIARLSLTALRYALSSSFGSSLKSYNWSRWWWRKKRNTRRKFVSFALKFLVWQSSYRDGPWNPSRGFFRHESLESLEVLKLDKYQCPVYHFRC